MPSQTRRFRLRALLLLAALLLLILVPAVAANHHQQRAAATAPRALPAYQHQQEGGASASSDEVAVATLHDMSVSQLRGYLREREASCSGCLERAQLVDRAMAVRGWLTSADRVAQQLTVVQRSAAESLTLQHLATSVPDEVVAAVREENAKRQQEEQFKAGGFSNGVVACLPAAVNGTVFCYDLNFMEQHTKTE